MPSTRKKTSTSGREYYEIRVSRGRKLAPLTTTWYPPEGWSHRAIERGLAKRAAEFERQVKNGETVSRAEQKEIERLEELENAKILTLRQYAERVFMPAIEIRCSENTRCSYQQILDHWILPALGDLKLPEISSADISSVLLSMQAQGRAQGTCIKAYTVFQSLFKMAYLADAIPTNPMGKVERPKPRKDEKRQDCVESYTVEEVCRIIEGLEHEPLKWRALIRLLIDTGIRRGECCALEWRSVDFAENAITISQNLCYTPQKGVYLDTPKNGKTRTIDVDPEVMLLLRELRATQPEISRFVFVQENGDPMNPQSPTRYMKKFAER